MISLCTKYIYNEKLKAIEIQYNYYYLCRTFILIIITILNTPVSYGAKQNQGAAMRKNVTLIQSLLILI